MRASPVFKKCLLAVASILALAATVPAKAQDSYPSKPITFIVPYAAGGSSDTRARQVAQQLGNRLNVPVVVENKPGASGNIGTAQLARAKPDGYTIGLGNFAPLSVNKSLYGKNLGFDPAKVAPIVLIERGALVLGVNAQAPYQSATELIADGRANPEKLNFASTGAGSASQLVSEALKQSTGMGATHVPYRGGAPAANDLMAGNLDFYLELASLFIPYAQGDEPRLRLLAVTGDKRLPALPQVPTFSELGVKDMVASNWFGVVAPAGTPEDVIERLNKEINAVLQDPEYRKIVDMQGAEVAGGTPQEFQAFIDSEAQRWGKLIEANNISIH